MSLLPPVLALLRRISLGRRIDLSMIVFAIAIMTMAAAGWRMLDLVTEHRQALVARRAQAQQVSAVAEATLRLHSLAHAQINRPDSVAASIVLQQHAWLGQAIDLLMPQEAEEARMIGALRDATRAFITTYSALQDLDHSIATTYDAVTDRTSEMMGVFAILGRQNGPGSGVEAPMPSALAASVQRANEAFLAAVVALNAYYQSRTTAKAEAAQAYLGRIRETVPVMQALTVNDMQTQALGALDDRALALATLIGSLVTQFGERAHLANQVLVEAQDAMERALADLSRHARLREDAVQASLETQARRTLQIVAVVAGGILGIGVIVTMAVAASIRRPILRLHAVMEDLAAGNWDRPVEGTEARDEVGAMARTLKVFKETALRAQQLEEEKRIALAAEKAETDRALANLDRAHQEITALNKRLSSENLRLAAELDVGRRLQTMLLPRAEDLARCPGLEIAAHMEPADEIGGDYYDILPQAEGLRIGIGDVTGHGLESGVVMLMAQSALRTLTIAGDRDPASILDVLNRSLYGSIQRLGGEKTLTFALIDHRAQETGGLLTVIGQHESLLVIRTDGRTEEVDTLPLGMPLGLVEDLCPFLGTIQVRLDPGDVVILYTDGVTEAAAPDNRLFGIGALAAVACRHRTAPAETIKAAILAAVADHIGTGPVYDDITLLVLKQGDAALPRLSSGTDAPAAAPDGLTA